MFRRPCRRLILPAEVVRSTVTKLMRTLDAALSWRRDRDLSMLLMTLTWPRGSMASCFPFSLNIDHMLLKVMSTSDPRKLKSISCHVLFLCWCTQTTPAEHTTDSLSFKSKPWMVCICVYLKDYLNIDIDTQRTSM